MGFIASFATLYICTKYLPRFELQSALFHRLRLPGKSLPILGEKYRSQTFCRFRSDRDGENAQTPRLLCRQKSLQWPKLSPAQIQSLPNMWLHSKKNNSNRNSGYFVMCLDYLERPEDESIGIVDGKVWLSGENNVEPPWKRTKLFRDRHPSLSTHDHGVSLVRTAHGLCHFGEIFHLFLQSPGKSSVQTNAHSFAGCHNQIHLHPKKWFLSKYHEENLGLFSYDECMKLKRKIIIWFYISDTD